MNFDQAVTVSDSWLWLKWLFYYPGDLAIHGVFGYLPGMVRFFELSVPPYGGTVAGVTSLLLWLLLFRLVGAARRSLSERYAYPLASATAARAEDVPLPTGRRLPGWMPLAVGMLLMIWIGDPA